MLSLRIDGKELWDSETEEFIYINATELYLEHSLHSISKWEAHWQKPFLTKMTKTQEELEYYIRCMAIGKYDDNLFKVLGDKEYELINDYIETNQTSIVIKQTKSVGVPKTITNELIYYWMISLCIPFECQYWHLSRLLALIEVCKRETEPPKKMGKNELLERNARINAERRAKLHTKG